MGRQTPRHRLANGARGGGFVLVNSRTAPSSAIEQGDAGNEPYGEVHRRDAAGTRFGAGGTGLQYGMRAGCGVSGRFGPANIRFYIDDVRPRRRARPELARAVWMAVTEPAVLAGGRRSALSRIASERRTSETTLERDHAHDRHKAGRIHVPRQPETWDRGLLVALGLRTILQMC